MSDTERWYGGTERQQADSRSGRRVLQGPGGNIKKVGSNMVGWDAFQLSKHDMPLVKPDEDEDKKDEGKECGAKTEEGKVREKSSLERSASEKPAERAAEKPDAGSAEEKT